MKKILKNGKVPLDKPVMILSKDNHWGHGTFFKWTEDSMGEKADGKIYCDFHSPQQTLLGEPKSSFLAYFEFPNHE